MFDIRFPSLEKDNQTFTYINKEGAMVIEGKEVTTREQKRSLRDFKKFLLRLGLLPLKTIKHPFGSTAHYAGGAPVGQKGDFPLTTDFSGKLNEDDKIYIADSATWKMLPAKAPTLTIMANANRVGRNVLKEFPLGRETSK
jgi:choline dehydrogenase-like flavoprotein